MSSSALQLALARSDADLLPVGLLPSCVLPANLGSWGAERVLVVGDSATRRELFREALSRHGLDSVGVTLDSAAAALGVASPTAVLMDLGRPDAATLRRARALVRDARIGAERVLGVVESADREGAARLRSWGIQRVSGWPAPTVLIALHVEQIVKAHAAAEARDVAPALSVLDGTATGRNRSPDGARAHLRVI